MAFGGRAVLGRKVVKIADFSRQKGYLVAGYLLLPLCMLLAACGNTMEEVGLFDSETPPEQTIRDGHVMRSENGRLQFDMTAPLIVKYRKPDARTVYPEGVEVTFFDEELLPKAFFTARYATQWDSTDMLRARDSVVIIDFRSHDTVYLQDLVWDSQQKRVYSENPVRAVNGMRITYGDSFESDDRFTNPRIIRQRGTIEWKDEDETPGDA